MKASDASAWPAVPLQRLASLRSGAGFPDEFQGVEDAELPFLKVRNLADCDGAMMWEHTVSRETAVLLRAHIVSPPAVVMAKIGAALLLARYRRVDMECCVDNNMLALEFGSAIDVRYGQYALSLLDMSFLVNPGAVPSLNMEAFRSARLPLPPIHRQLHIARYLDRETARIDGLVAEQEALIASLEEHREVAITRAVLHQSSGSVALKRCVAVTDCKHLTAEFVDDGLPLASIGQVGERFVDLATAQRTTVDFFASLREGGRAPKGGDLIMTRNATVGAVALVPDDIEPFAMGQDVCLISPRGEIESRFLYYVLKSRLIADQVASMGVGTTFKRINVETIRNLNVPVHDRSTQCRIADHLDELTRVVDQLMSECRELIALLKERRAALITAAVTGQIDVRAN